jgi:hypothetical protein
MRVVAVTWVAVLVLVGCGGSRVVMPEAPAVWVATGGVKTVMITRGADGGWSEAYLKASNPDAYDDFGQSVALSADGTVLAVGAPCEGSGAAGIGGDESRNDVPCSGATYVFGRAGRRT